jgi:hypothetical protein
LTLEGVVTASRKQTGIEQIEEYFRKMRTKLPPQTSISVITSKEGKGKIEGTSFVAELQWGAGPKP